MAEQRKKSMSILLWFPGKTRPTKLELFPAEQWPDHPDAEPGLFRVRKGGRWISGPDGPLFFSLAGITGLLGQALGDPDLAAVEAEAPTVRRKDYVRYMSPDPESRPRSMRTWVTVPPFQGMDGLWRCFVLGVEGPVRCVDLEVL